MRFKLRDTVAFAPTTEGMLFRVADDFLPVKGKDVWSWFQRLRPFLDGRTNIEQFYECMNERKRRIVDKLLEALKQAGMVYDTDEDDSGIIPRAISEHCAGLIARTEARSSQPLRAFSKARHSRLLVVGHLDMALVVIDAGLEAGLCRQTLWAVDWTSNSSESLKRVLAQRRARELSLVVDLMHRDSARQCIDSISDYDAVVIAGTADTNIEAIEARLNSATRAAPWVFALLSDGNSALSCTLRTPSAAGPIACIREYYKQFDRSLPLSSAYGQSAGIAIGARLLVQTLLDSLTEILAPENQLMFYELDLRTFEVHRRPLLPNPGCMICRDTRGHITGKWPFADHSSQEVSAEAFLEQAEKCFVDEKTGLIAQLDEGDLLQFPHHQSAALYRLPGQRSPHAWITECGEDVNLARMAVVQRALERHLGEGVVGLQPSVRLPIYRSLGDYAGDCSRSDLPAGLVVSATSSRQLVAEAFFRALALHGQESDGWFDTELPRAHLSTEAELTLAYLDDIEAVKDIQVQRNAPLSVCGCEMLRFRYRGKCASVIAGSEGPSMWTTGLKDVWLHVTALEAFANCPGTAQAVRFRCPETPLDVLSTSVEKLKARLNLDLGLAPLPWIETKLAEPFFFTYAYISRGRIHF